MLKKCAFCFCSILVLLLLGYYIDKSTPPLTAKPPDEFALFTMPKTGTHLMRPLLEYLTDLSSESYWSPEIKCPKTYLYDKKLMALSLSLPGVVQPYWLHQPIHKDCLASVLNELNEDGDFLVTHAPYALEMEKLLQKRNSLVFFLIRDPRDWVISIIKHPPVSGVDIFGRPIGDRRFEKLTIDQKIHTILTGTPEYYSALEILNKFLPWRNSPVCCTLRFEALLGPRGGFSEKDQLAELRKISNALHLDLPDEILLDAYDESFGTGHTFLKGKAGTWKDHFTEDHKRLFKKELGAVLIELGYEKDDHW